MSGRAQGSLLLVPNTLDHGSQETPIGDVLALGVLQRAAALTHWIAEDVRSARAFLKRVAAVAPLALPLQAIQIVELPRPRKGDHQPIAAAQWQALLQPAQHGHDVGLLSEAGLPAVADPGAALVEAAHRLGVAVLPLPGPSALMLALAGSGFNGQNFAFVGYLPQERAARIARLRDLETHSRRLGQTQIFIETPYRNQAVMESMLECLQPSTWIAIGCGLTLAEGWMRSQPVERWRAAPPALPDRLPAVFLLLAR